MKISIIVAISTNNVIGLNGKLPWKVHSDLKYFKNVTMGHHIIMGRKTFEELNNSPLFGRTNIVLSNNKFFKVPEDLILKHNLKDAIKLAEMNGDDECFIIGGRDIYELALPIADKLYITEIHCNVNGDVFFPEYDKGNWRLVKIEDHKKDEKNQYDYSFTEYEKKND